MMTQQCLIVITGPVASGKTTLSQRLAADFGLPLLNRDQFKELLFDTLGWSDRAWSKRVGIASYSLLYYSLEQLLKTRQPAIIESNFQSNLASTKLAQLCQMYNYAPLQLCCTTAPELLIKRYSERITTGARHPGHAEQAAGPLQTNLVPDMLAIGGEHYLLDTTSETTLDYPYVMQLVRRAIG